MSYLSQVGKFLHSKYFILALMCFNLCSQQGIQVEPPIAFLRMDTIATVSTDLESSSEESSSGCPLDGPTLSVRI